MGRDGGPPSAQAAAASKQRDAWRDHRNVISKFLPDYGLPDLGGNGNGTFRTTHGIDSWQSTNPALRQASAVEPGLTAQRTQGKRRRIARWLVLSSFCEAGRQGIVALHSRAGPEANGEAIRMGDAS